MSTNTPDPTPDYFPTTSKPILQDVLIVDDTLENLRVLSSILTDHHYNVRKATGGMMALKVVETLAPDLILLDIMMPDLSGYQVCKELKKNPRTANIPIIFLSALDDVLDKVTAFEIGGADYITKPFQIEEVLVRVKNQLALTAAQYEIQQLNTWLETRVEERTKQLMIAHNRLQEIAFYDSLTGLANRTLFLEELEKFLYRSRNDAASNFAVFYLDCDRFKVINDSLGHSVGNKLLKKIAYSLQNILRKNDILARLGADEFAVLLPDISDAISAIEIAERILEIFKQPFYCGDHEIFINLSIGIVLNSLNDKKPEDILQNADTAMYQAKSLGRGQYQIFAPTMYEIAQQRLKLETDLHRAVQQEEFTVHYQPIIELETGKIAGFEALVRWLHPQEGLVSPGKFLPLAEETGLICPIGSWVMQQACHQLYQWQQQGFESLKMYVNLAAKQLNQATLVTEIDRILTETKIDSTSLKLEITESSMMQDLPLTKRLLERLREKGIQLSIDDFGTGYSSLSQLQNFPVNTLKIDRSFLKILDGNPENLGLVPVILSIANVMDMEVVAEGIETIEQLQQLRALGCQFGQGFLFSKPLEADAATQFMTQTLQ